MLHVVRLRAYLLFEGRDEVPRLFKGGGPRRAEEPLVVCAREVSMAEVPIAGTGFCADVKVSGQRRRLFATETGYGVAANMYSLTEMRWLCPPHYFSSINEGQRWAECEVRAYLRTMGQLAALRIRWIGAKPGSTSG